VTAFEASGGFPFFPLSFFAIHGSSVLLFVLAGTNVPIQLFCSSPCDSVVSSDPHRHISTNMTQSIRMDGTADFQSMYRISSALHGIFPGIHHFQTDAASMTSTGLLAFLSQGIQRCLCQHLVFYAALRDFQSTTTFIWPFTEFDVAHDPESETCAGNPTTTAATSRCHGLRHAPASDRQPIHFRSGLVSPPLSISHIRVPPPPLPSEVRVGMTKYHG
jgi:hypothetical protein